MNALPQFRGIGFALCFYHTNAELKTKEKTTFMTKKRKIQNYLDTKTNAEKCAFDFLLCDYLNGTLKMTLESFGIKKISIYIDWSDHLKCIDIQGRYKKYFVESQIYPHEFSVAFDLIEADDDITYPLGSKEQVYNVFSATVESLK